MALSNRAIPKYYGAFREAVMRGDIPVNEEISMEMHRIDALIENPGIWYDDEAVEGFIRYCENELTLTDGEDLVLLDTIFNNSQRCCQITIRILYSKLFLECRYLNNASSSYCTNNETSRRSAISY